MEIYYNASYIISESKDIFEEMYKISAQEEL